MDTAEEFAKRFAAAIDMNYRVLDDDIAKVEADRAAMALAVLDEVIEACSRPMSIPFPMRAVLNDLRARYQKGKSDV